MFRTHVFRACTDARSPRTVVQSLGSSAERPTITWGASVTLAPYVVAARCFFWKLAQSLSAAFSQKRPVKNLRKSPISSELFACVDNAAPVSSQRQPGDDLSWVRLFASISRSGSDFTKWKQQPARLSGTCARLVLSKNLLSCPLTHDGAPPVRAGRSSRAASFAASVP